MANQCYIVFPNAESKEFDFLGWCTVNKLKDATVSKLEEEELTTVTELLDLTGDDVSELGLTLAQRKALKRALEILRLEYGGTGEIDDAMTSSTLSLDSGHGTVGRPSLEHAHQEGPASVMKMLNQYELDGHYWSRIFSEEVQVTSVGQLKFLTRENFLALAGRKHKAWEERALEKLLADHGANIGEGDLYSPSSLSLSPKSPFSSVVDVRRQYERLVKLAGVQEHIPGKLSLQNVMAINDDYRYEPGDKCRFGIEFIRGLIMLECDIFETMYPKLVGENSTSSTASSSSLDFFSSVSAAAMHTQDLFLLSFLSCDHFLKQTLMQKLSLCRLAFPFIYPTFRGKQESLEHPLWSFRSVVIEWRDEKKRSVESGLVNANLFAVSFCKFGDQLAFSKSKLLNDLMNTDSHPTFFHRDCQGGMSHRVISNGVVEAACYLPGNRLEGGLQNVTLFLNLRGNAAAHQNQLNLLAQMSSVMVALVDVNDVADPGCADHIRSILRLSSVLVLFCAKSDNINFQKLQDSVTQLQQSLSSVSENKLLFSFTFHSGGMKNAKQINDEVTANIIKCLTRKTSLLDMASILKNNEVAIDEDSEECQGGMQMAKEVVSHMRERPLHEVKREMMPLQHHWVEWSDLQKKARRVLEKDKNKTTAEQRFLIEEDMRKIREQQVAISKNPSLLFQNFLKHLTATYMDESVSREAIFFLQWLRYELDEKCREFIPMLAKEYQLKWREYKDAKSSRSLEPGQVQEKLQGMQDAEQQLADASLGLEHLMRELGQMYEAIADTSNTMDPKIKALPNIVAHFLLQGHPLEVMDGDASNIPLTWIEAIFTSLENLIGQKRFFIVSVLGIQSSGKSTLLNTMFGLQFAVSAGRCTRGVYMQIVKVDPERSMLPFDYVLVVDSEGLRAPELGQLKFDRDNEIATFVIGLGDVAVMNIKGENYGEMKDVLQIAVHAFLRMKLVSSYQHSRHRCIFLHQNVPAVNAEEKLMHSCQKLQEILDDMTSQAAEQENIVDVKSFSQIIDFDCQTHVGYFPDFWHGDPPMAHTNKGYTEKVKQVKDQILTEFTKRQSTFMTIMDICQEIKDVWNGILTDDFVFSFRNCLEVKTYNSLEKKLKELTLSIEENLNQWYAETGEISIDACEDETASVSCQQSLCKDLSTKVGHYLKDYQERLEQFCSESLYKDILQKWEKQAFESLESTVENIHQQVRQRIHDTIKERTLELRHSKNSAHQEAELIDKAVALANKLRGEKKDMFTLENSFGDMWKKWIADFDVSSISSEDMVRRIQTDIENTALNWNRWLKLAINQALINEPLDIRKPPMETLVDCWTIDDIPRDRFSIQKGLRGYIDADTTSRHCREDALMRINGIFTKVQNYIQQLPKVDTQFHTMHVTKLFEFVSEVTEKPYTVQTYTYAFKAEIRAKIMVEIANFAFPRYVEMHREYQTKHTFAAKIEKYQEKAWNLFNSSIREKEEELIAIDLMVDTLKVHVLKRAKRASRVTIYEQGSRKFLTKHRLIYHMLTDLAEQGSLQDYRHYIRQPLYAAQQWMQNYISDTYFNRSKHEESQYMQIMAQEVKHICDRIKAVVETVKSNVNEEDMVFPESIKNFCHQANKIISVNQSQLSKITFHKIHSTLNYWDGVYKGLDQIPMKLAEILGDITMETVDWGTAPVYDDIVSNLWGCSEKCPFCGEPCQRSEKNHMREHSCIQHRPRGFSGWYEDDTEELIRENCNFAVQSNDCFDCHATTCTTHEQCSKDNPDEDVVYHDFRNYRKHLPSWDIHPSSVKDSSPYWSWVFCKYGEDLANELNLAPPLVPSSWKSISKQQAKQSLGYFYG